MARTPGVYKSRLRKALPTFGHVSEIDWARLAVLIDGEGSIGIHRTPRQSKSGWHMRVVLEVANTDPRMMKWLHELLGGTVRCKDNSSQRRHICFKWQIVGTGAHVILTKCLPYFLIKRDQAETAIAFRETLLINKGARW